MTIKLKNKTKIMLTVLIIGFVLIVSGCSIPGIGNGQKESSFLGTGSSSSGGSGVSLTFDDNYPPKEALKGQPITFGLIFTNFQEHKIEDLKLRVSGYDKNIVTGIESEYTNIQIPKKDDVSGVGMLNYEINNVKVENFEDTFMFNPVFDYCYDATTTYREQICVPAIKKSECATPVSASKKENGPLQISIDKVVAYEESKIRVYFTLSNKGGGQVVKSDDCFKDEFATPYTVTVMMGSQTGTCTTNSGEFQIMNDKGAFFCEFGTDGDIPYASQISAELHYKYKQTSKVSIKVVDPTQ